MKPQFALHIAPLGSRDRAEWLPLARAYKDFYRTAVSPEGYEAAWQRVLAREDVFGLGARLEGRLVGIAHYLFHANTWTGRVCYLQDLFVVREMRSQGIARALIHAVADEARGRGCERYYWLTQETNTTARALYDKVAKYHGFVRYDYEL